METERIHELLNKPTMHRPRDCGEAGPELLFELTGKISSCEVSHSRQIQDFPKEIHKKITDR